MQLERNTQTRAACGSPSKCNLTRSPPKVSVRVLAHSPRQSALLSDEQVRSLEGTSPEAQRISGADNGRGHSRKQLFGSKAVAALAAATIAGAGLIAPLPGLAEELNFTPHVTQVEQQLKVDSSAASLLSSTAPLLQAAEAPSLVADSSDVIMQAAKDVVTGSLPDLATNSMTAVGGPVMSPRASSSNEETSAAAQQSAAATEGPSTAAPAVAAAEPQQQQQQQQQNNIMCSLWQGYCHALETSPLMTKIYTGIVGTFIGDLAAQVLSYQASKKTGSSSAKGNEGFKFDAARSLRLCLYSAAIGTPMGHYEYALLEKFVMPDAPTSAAAVAAKVCLDQFVQTPFGMTLFFAVMKVLEGKPHLVKEEMSKVGPALLANWKLWPAAQLINFTVIPTEQRILFGNIVGICWTCIISNLQQGSTASSSSEAEVSSSSRRSSAAGDAVEALQVSRPETPVPVVVKTL